MSISPDLYGHDLFGDPIEVKPANKLSGDFHTSPFSVLSSRDGWWQERKSGWIGLGIKSEVGRDQRFTYGEQNIKIDSFLGSTASKEKVRSYKTSEWVRDKGIAGNSGKTAGNGTSIFDPVLCELAYRWFCPPGGMVLDPFAGGSVRGVVAALLGYRYWGCELRPAQVAANYDQAADLCPDALRIPVKVSAASARQMFHPCEPDYIRDVCHAACGCRGSSSEPAKRLGGICVTVHDSETDHIANLGATVLNGFILPDDRGMCPFNDKDGLCGIHDKGKPFGCAASPFTLNDNDTLIVRNRYRLLKCYKDDGAVPAYVAHRASLDRIFGADEAARIARHLDDGGDDLTATIDPASYAMLRDNDDAKHGGPSSRSRPTLSWVVGDARERLDDAPDADFLFTCPPYFNLEVYSDDPRDLSAMDWDGFVAAYRQIIHRAASRLRPDRFAAFVVGDVRDKDGYYRGLPELTVAAFADAGCRKYNEGILVNPVGSLPIRVGAQFTKSRKLGKTHQNVLVFIKGCPKKATRMIPVAG